MCMSAGDRFGSLCVVGGGFYARRAPTPHARPLRNPIQSRSWSCSFPDRHTRQRVRVILRGRLVSGWGANEADGEDVSRGDEARR